MGSPLIDVAANQLLNSSTDDSAYLWGARPLLTLANVQGMPETCVYSASYPFQTSPCATLCNLISSALIYNLSYSANQHLAAPNGTWFTCTSGITPCLFTQLPEHCILVHIFPQVYWHSGDNGRSLFSLAIILRTLPNLKKPCSYTCATRDWGGRINGSRSVQYSNWRLKL